MKTSIIEYCATIGADPLLVQGAGGNVSWKDGDTLWIKASGAWLADAATSEIFVPVEFPGLVNAIALGDFGVVPIAKGKSSLRPSIETLLHALMPHPVVVHLHSVEILAHLVRDTFVEAFASLTKGTMRWVSVPYHKPGAALAKAVNAALDRVPDANVIFLQNHGVVVGGADVAEVGLVLNLLTSVLATQPINACDERPSCSALVISDSLRYMPVPDADIHRLSTNLTLFARLDTDWAICPDHVVFLGPKPRCYPNVNALVKEASQNDNAPELAFVRNVGVYVKPEFNRAKLAQLRCYYDVMTRQSGSGTINALSDEQIAELLDWDAEKYRMRIAK